MHGVRVVVAYDGTAYGGWQLQVNAPTIQGALERAVAKLAGAPCRVRGASRTDAGVHAMAQVAAFDSPREIAPYKWVRGLNGALPEDIGVQSAAVVPVGYNPRHEARWKRYRYLLHLSDLRDPLLRHRAWQLGPRRTRPRPPGGRERPEDWLDLDAMDEAAARMVGEHDFAAFKSARDPRKDTVRTLDEVRVIRGFGGRADVVAIEVRGRAFLHNMVRIIAGTLVEVGRERLSVADVAALLGDDADRAEAGETAPGHGLYLAELELAPLS